MSWSHAIVVFLSSALGDFIWAFWSMMTSAKRAFMSAIAAVGILLIGVVAIDAYIQSRWYVVPAAFGGGLSTYATVKYAKWKENKSTP